MALLRPIPSAVDFTRKRRKKTSQCQSEMGLTSYLSSRPHPGTLTSFYIAEHISVFKLNTLFFCNFCSFEYSIAALIYFYCYFHVFLLLLFSSSALRINHVHLTSQTSHVCCFQKSLPTRIREHIAAFKHRTFFYSSAIPSALLHFGCAEKGIETQYWLTPPSLYSTYRRTRDMARG